MRWTVAAVRRPRIEPEAARAALRGQPLTEPVSPREQHCAKRRLRLPKVPAHQARNFYGPRFSATRATRHAGRPRPPDRRAASGVESSSSPRRAPRAARRALPLSRGRSRRLVEQPARSATAFSTHRQGAYRGTKRVHQLMIRARSAPKAELLIRSICRPFRAFRVFAHTPFRPSALIWQQGGRRFESARPDLTESERACGVARAAAVSAASHTGGWQVARGSRRARTPGRPLLAARRPR
jgi:hypothetical protein